MNRLRLLMQAIQQNQILFGVLVLSAFARGVIVWRGGQEYFPDSSRYWRAVDWIGRLSTGDWEGGLDLLLNTPDHPGFLLGLGIPVGIQYLVKTIFAQPVNSTLWITSLFLASMSILSIIVVAAIARRVGAGMREASVAAILMASSTSMFYFARHLVPYDLALAIALCALWVGLAEKSKMLHSIACGCLASLVFLTYNGYWTIAGIVVLVHIVWRPPDLTAIVKRGIASAIGFLIPPALLVALSFVRGIPSYLSALSEFAGSVNQGTMSEGWSLPWEYLWHAEHGLLLVWLIGIAMIVGRWFADRRVSDKRGLLWLGIIGTIYAALVIGSVGLDKFVVYGRIVRQMIPFACLAAATNVEHLPRILKNRWAVRTGILLFAAQVAFNFSAPLAQQFPAEIERVVLANYNSVGRTLTVKGPPIFGDVLDATHRYVLVNAQYLFPISGTRKLPAGKTIFQTNHPLRFLPYQYEGLDPGERAIIRSVDLAIRLIDLN